MFPTYITLGIIFCDSSVSSIIVAKSEQVVEARIRFDTSSSNDSPFGGAGGDTHKQNVGTGGGNHSPYDQGEPDVAYVPSEAVVVPGRVVGRGFPDDQIDLSESSVSTVEKSEHAAWGAVDRATNA